MVKQYALKLTNPRFITSKGLAVAISGEDRINLTAKRVAPGRIAILNGATSIGEAIALSEARWIPNNTLIQYGIRQVSIL